MTKRLKTSNEITLRGIIHRHKINDQFYMTQDGLKFLLHWLDPDGYKSGERLTIKGEVTWAHEWRHEDGSNERFVNVAVYSVEKTE